MDLNQKSQKGVREDIADIVIELQAEDTPAFSLIRKGAKPGAPVMQQPVDAPGYVSRRGVKNRTAAKPVADMSKDYNLLESCNHMLTQSIGVGKKDMATVDRAGVGMGKLYARELSKGILAMKTALDCITLDKTDQRDEGSEGSETRGLFSWASPTAQSCRPVPEKYRPNSGAYKTTAFANITPTTFQEALAARWAKTRTKGRLIGFIGDELKGVISNWSMYLPDKTSNSTVRHFSQDVAAGKKERVLSAIIDMLEFDTATVELHLEPNLCYDRDAEEDYEMPTEARRSCIMFPKDAVSYHFAQSIEHEELGNSGAGKEGQLSTIFHTMVTPFELVAINPAS